MLLPLYSTASVSALKRAPPQRSQLTRTSGRKLISIFLSPCPRNLRSGRPTTLNEKRLDS